MSQFKRDMTEKMRDPEYAYEFGRAERELEIIKLLEEMFDEWVDIRLETLIAIIKGENK